MKKRNLPAKNGYDVLDDETIKTLDNVVWECNLVEVPLMSHVASLDRSLPHLGALILLNLK